MNAFSSDMTILLAVPHGFAARYLLRTDILPTLLEHGARVVILTPNPDEEYFREEFGRPGVVIESFLTEKSEAYFQASYPQRFMRTIRLFTLNARGGDITTVDDMFAISRAERGKTAILHRARNILLDSSIYTLRRSKLLRRAFRTAESNLFPGRFYQDLFDRYRPNLLVTTSLGYFRHDDYLMRAARRNSVPTASVILSWDNTTSWGMSGAPYDWVIAQTETMRRELIGLHDTEDNRIFVEGVAYFDHYFAENPPEDRSTFFKRFGLDPDKRLILLSTQSPNIFPWNADMIAMLAEAVEDGRLPGDCQIVARLHPLHLRYQNGRAVYQDLFDEYERLQQRYPFIVFNRPKLLSKRLEADMPTSEMVDVYGLLHFADVQINQFSTIAVEGCIFDLPTINLGFEPGDQAKKTRLKHSSDLAARRSHNRRITETGGVPTVYSPEELIDLTRRYLENPSLHKVERMKVVENECHPNPGCAGRRIGLRLLELASQGRQ